MQVISSNFSAQDLLEELGMTYKGCLRKISSFKDELIDLVVQKRFEESPEVE